MGTEGYIYPGERQTDIRTAAGVNDSPFLEYQMPGFGAGASGAAARSHDAVREMPTCGASRLNTQQDYSSPAPYYDQNYVPPPPPALVRADGRPIQGTGTNYRHELQVIDPHRLAAEQACGRISHEMIYACNQIWEANRNPQDLNRLLEDVNTDLQRMGTPYRFGSCLQLPPEGAIPGTLPRMSIDFEDMRAPQRTNRIYLH
jgi:hypothetical protein